MDEIRKFNGENFRFYNEYSHIFKAEEAKRKLKSEGYRVRIIAVYVGKNTVNRVYIRKG